MNQSINKVSPVMLFYSYAPEDEVLRNELEKYLSLLRRQGVITSWSNRQIIPGADWTQEIDIHISNASIILLLISPDFLASRVAAFFGVRSSPTRCYCEKAGVVSPLYR